MSAQEKAQYTATLAAMTENELRQEYKTCNSRTKQDMIIRELHRRSEVPA